MTNNFILLMGKSGSGKTTVANELYNRYGLSSIESYTTRPPRYKGERGHTFISDEEFDELTDMVAYTDFNGYRYCATSEQVEDNQIYIIDPAGVDYFDEHYVGDKDVIVVYLDVDDDICFERMVKDRGVEEAEARLKNDAVAFKDARAMADVCIENEDLTTTVNMIREIWRHG